VTFGVILDTSGRQRGHFECKAPELRKTKDFIGKTYSRRTQGRPRCGHFRCSWAKICPKSTHAALKHAKRHTKTRRRGSRGHRRGQRGPQGSPRGKQLDLWVSPGYGGGATEPRGNRGDPHPPCRQSLVGAPPQSLCRDSESKPLTRLYRDSKTPQRL